MDTLKSISWHADGTVTIVFMGDDGAPQDVTLSEDECDDLSIGLSEPLKGCDMVC